MKQQSIVTAVGAPTLEALSESERGIFCEALLRRITALAERACRIGRRVPNDRRKIRA